MEEDLIEVSLEENQQAPEGRQDPGGQQDPEVQQGAEVQQDPEVQQEPEGQQNPEGQQAINAKQEAARRHYFAAQRRQQEEAQRKAAHDAEIDAIYAKAYEGQLNPYTGLPIRGKKDYEEYQRAYREDMEQQQRQKMQESGVNPFTIESMIAKAIKENPVVQQAEEVVAHAEMMEQQARQTQRTAMINSGLQEIAAMDPRVKNAEDLKNLYADTWDEMLGYVRAGIPLAKAWRAANMDTLMQQGRNAGRQAALNAMGTKSHMRSMQSQGKQTVTMPREVMEQYRQIVPGHTDAEYARHWAKNHKE